MSIKTMSQNSRPRERAFSIGIDKISDVELLAILISSGTHGASALSLATDLIEKTGSLAGLSRINLSTLNLKGLGRVKKLTILAAIELGKRAIRQKEGDHLILSDAFSIYQFVYPKYFGLLQEKLSVILLDENYKFVYEERQEKGNFKDISVSLSWIMHVCANNLTPYVVLIHNHPSNNVIPSTSDDITTYSVMESLKLMQIKLLDHIIVGENSFFSYKEEKRLDKLKEMINL